MNFKQKLLNTLNLSSFEKIESDLNKHNFILFLRGLGLGVLVGWFMNWFVKKR